MLEGPVEDLNVMTRRGQFKASVKRFWITAEMETEVAFVGTTIFVAESGEISVYHAGRSCVIAQHDAVIFDQAPDGQVVIQARDHAMLLVIQIVVPDVD